MFPICVRTASVLVCLLVPGFASGATTSAEARAGRTAGWPSLAFLAHAPAAEFHAFVAPLATFAKYTYTSTAGSTDYEPGDANATVPGWTRSGLRHDPPEGGMRALLFLDDATAKGVVAFRGTDLNAGSPSGRADACADRLLWGGVAPPDLPTACDAFPARDLDYLARARDFVASVRAAHPERDLLLTGHSLGAGLAAILAAADYNMTAAVAAGSARQVTRKAVVFSSPGTRRVLRERSRIRIAEVDSREIVVVADVWDPVYVAAERGRGLVGTPCAYATPPGPACEACYRRPALNMSRPDCEECFLQHHIFGHYLRLVNSSATRPDCTAPPAPLAGGRSPGRRELL